MGDVTTLFRLDPEALRCPYPLLDAVRDEHPVLFVPEIECWLVTRYADIVQVARDPQTFSSKMPTGPVLARQQLEAVQARYPNPGA
jgi:cytochrome P450